MACSNCFNGCTEISSDQCVRYTGASIPALDITTGDSLAVVEEKITTFILTLSDASGIIPTIDPGDLCALVEGFLPISGTINLNQVISALIQSVCALKTSVDANTANISTIEANYTIGCLTGVTASSGTHAILQAAITKLCATDATLQAFMVNVATNYVAVADLDQLIQDYLDSIAPTTSLQKNKMVPYVAYEYYGPLTGFDVSGAGSGDWIDVYLCNGQNGTPDKRGRVAVGTTDGSMQGGAMSSVVNPANPGNPNYVLGGTSGANTVVLTSGQLPSHSHSATATSTASPHSHFIAVDGPADTDLTSGQTLDWFSTSNYSYKLRGTLGTANLGPTNNATVNVTTTVTVGDFGGNQGHSNVQPSIGAYFIMYIP